MKNRRDRLIVFMPLIISVVLIIGILLGNWITGIRVKGIVSDEINNQRFFIRPGNNSGLGISLTPKGNKVSSALQYILNEYALFPDKIISFLIFKYIIINQNCFFVLFLF